MRRAHRRAHRRIWWVMAALLPAILLLGHAIRRDGPLEAAPVLIEAPPR